MSSIFEALQKLEAAEAETETRRLVAVVPPRPSRLPLVVVGLLASFAAGGGAVFWLARGRVATGHQTTAPTPTRQAATPAAPSVVAPPTAASATPPTAAPPVVASVTSSAAPPIVVSATPPAAPVPSAATLNPAAREIPPTRAPLPTTEPTLVHVPAAPPHVDVSFLAYSASPARRTVALRIEGGSLFTLHEGEEVRGVKVARIFSDRVELRHDGATFSVRVTH